MTPLRRVSAAAYVAAGILLSACGGGGSSSSNPGPAAQPPAPPPADNQAPTLNLIFPGIASLTDAGQIELVIGADDPDGDAITDVQALHAGLTTGFAQQPNGNWRSSAISLSKGLNSIAVSADDANGERAEITVEVTRTGILTQPRAIALSQDSDALIVLDTGQRSLSRLERSSQMLDTLSGPTIGTGPRFGTPSHFVLSQAGEALVADGFNLVRVDLATGDRSTALSLIPTVPFIATINALALDDLNNVLFLLMSNGALQRVDLNTVPLAATSIGSGVPSQRFFSDAVYVAGTIYATDLIGRDVLSVDIATGVVSEFISPPGINGFSGIEYEAASDTLYLIDSGGAVSRFPLPAGPIENLTSGGAGLVSAGGLAIDGESGFTTTLIAKSLVEIDLGSGNVDTLAASNAGSGPAFSTLFAGRLDPTNSRLVVLGIQGVGALDPQTGGRSTLINLVPAFGVFGPAGPSMALDLNADGSTAWFSNLSGNTLSQADLATQMVTEVSGPIAGSGPSFNQISGLTVDADGAAAYVADGGFTSRILRVDLQTGERELILQLGSLGLRSLRDILLDEAQNRLILDLRTLGPLGGFELASLDLDSLDMTTLASFPDGGNTGPVLIGGARVSRWQDEIYHLLNETAGGLIGRTSIDGMTQSSISQLADPGPYPFLPTAPIRDSDGVLYLLDNIGVIYVIDEDNGARAVISI